MASKKQGNEFIVVPIFDKGRTLSKEYKYDEVDKILKQVPFQLISVPIFGYRNELMDDDSKRGNFIAGFVSKYIPETHELEVGIYDRYKQLLEYKDPIIYPRVNIIANGSVVGIAGLDFCSSSYYRVLNR